MTGILAEANAREMMSLRARCLVIRLGAILHTKAWRPHVSPMTHTDRSVQRRDRDRAVKPPPLELPHRQDGDHPIGSANSQSPLCLAAAAKKAAFCHGSLLLLSTESRAASRPGL